MGNFEVEHAVKRALLELGELFLPHCKLTFVMRNPKQPETGHAIVSDDDIGKLGALLMKVAEENKEGGE